MVWLLRVSRCRGFGIQSPNDYRFVRYVVNEHWPYYAYEDLRRELPDIDSRQRRLCELYFRIANFRQPSLIVDIQPTAAAYARYMQAGCNKAKITNGVSTAEADIVRINADGVRSDDLQKALAVVTSRSIMIVEGIYRDRNARRLWRALLKDERTGVTFDLYYCGIIFFDSKRHKRNYVVNF